MDSPDGVVHDIYDRLKVMGETLIRVETLLSENRKSVDSLLNRCHHQHGAIDDDISDIKRWQARCEGHKEGAERTVRSHAIKVSLLTGAIYTIATLGILAVAWFELVRK